MEAELGFAVVAQRPPALGQERREGSCLALLTVGDAGAFVVRDRQFGAAVRQGGERFDPFARSHMGDKPSRAVHRVLGKQAGEPPLPGHTDGRQSQDEPQLFTDRLKFLDPGIGGRPPEVFRICSRDVGPGQLERPGFSPGHGTGPM